MKEKAGQPVWDPREPREREMLWMPRSRKAFFICMDTEASSRKADFISSSIGFYSSIMNLRSLPSVSHSIGTSPHCEVKMESQFCKCKKPVRGLLWQAVVAFPQPEGEPHPVRQRGKCCSPFENVSLFKAAFLPWAHVPAGSFLRRLGCKMGPQGQAQKDCKVLRLFLWMTTLTRRYSDSLCSQGLQKPASSSFLTRFYLWVFFTF